MNELPICNTKINFKFNQKRKLRDLTKGQAFIMIHQRPLVPKHSIRNNNKVVKISA